MAKKHHLYELIQTMTGPEKRYFKLWSSNTTGNDSSDYQVLFDILQAQTAFDDDAFKVAAKKKTTLKNLSVGKNYLYQSLLKSLRNYHSGNDPKITGLEHRMNAEILYAKGLYEHAWDELIRYKKVGYYTENLP